MGHFEILLEKLIKLFGFIPDYFSFVFQMVFSGLEEGTEYVYTVRAATKQGSGPWSEKTSFTTTKEMVRAPMGLKAMATSDQSVEVWWEPIPTVRHKLLGYQVT